MANIKSQIKRNRQNETRRARNKAVRSELKTREKAVFAAAAAGEPTDELKRRGILLDGSTEDGHPRLLLHHPAPLPV